MKSLVLTIAVLGLVAFAGTAHAGAGCFGSFQTDKTAEVPPPPPPPAPST